jgi:hypothetical protein
MNRIALLEIMHDFVPFGGGVKKLPRVHQYFGITVAQAFVLERSPARRELQRQRAEKTYDPRDPKYAAMKLLGHCWE